MGTRLKSSFIYLANAVNDLRGNCATLAFALAPLVVISALFLLPDALNLQHGLAQRFAPGTRSVHWVPAQVPYQPSADAAQPEFSVWALRGFHLMVFAITLAAELIVLCAIRRGQTGVRKAQPLSEAIAIYREAVRAAPAFAWVVFLQLGLPAIAVLALQMDFIVSAGWIAIVIYIALVTLMVVGSLIYLWLYFAPYSLVFKGEHSFRALLASRDLLRKRFYRVAMRIVVFLAVWSGFSSWAAILFFAVSLIVGPVAVLTGYLWGTIFLVDLAAVAVTYATNAFFISASYRLYQDLTAIAEETKAVATAAAMPALSETASPAP